MDEFCPRCSSRLELKQIEDRKRFICPECRWVYYKNPLPSVAALIRNNKGDVLLIPFSGHRKIIQDVLKEEKR